MLDGLPRVLGSTEEEGVGTGRLAERKLVEGEALTSSLLDTGTGSAGEAKGGDRELGNVVEADVVSDGRDGDNGVLLGEGLVGLGDLAGDARDRHGGAVDLAHVEAAEDDLVETRVGATGEEAVKLLIEGGGRGGVPGKRSVRFEVRGAGEDGGAWAGRDGDRSGRQRNGRAGVGSSRDGRGREERGEVQVGEQWA